MRVSNPSNPSTLHGELVSLTVGGAGASVEDAKIARISSEFLKRAIPGIELHDVRPIRTLAALNSVCAQSVISRLGFSTRTSDSMCSAFRGTLSDLPAFMTPLPGTSL